ncbi:MAG TPA: NADH-quinone oxidoreductase subunit H [Planctomycetota bacterium]|nr:NADH-quinone oxidoreductase subunit H [Planctomycetota bacterium]
MSLGVTLLKSLVGFLFVLQMLPVMIYLERKVSAFIQDRVGPNRAFIPGLGLRLAGVTHTLTDVVKLLFKEDIVPRQANRFYYALAPGLAMFTALMVGAVVPYCHPLTLTAADGSSWTLSIQAIDANVGLLFLFAISSLGVYAVVLAGWASNNKYSQLGGLRASASMISYEITLGLAVVGLLLVYNSPDLNVIAAKQGELIFGFIPRWGVFLQPVAFVLYVVAAFAETNRNPFDLAEGESELVAGFHTEYGSFKFALFFMAEYVNIVVQSLVMATLFFGGWQIPWVSHRWLSEPGHAAGVLKGVLIGVAVVGALAGLKLLSWDRKNRRRWTDARRREGKVLAVLFGFGPAITAVVALVLWSGALGVNGGAVTAAVLQFAVLAAKTLAFCLLFIFVRWTTPRFRYDQLMALGWKYLLPIGLANLLVTGLLVQAGIL